jgi:hypothetical protein
MSPAAGIRVNGLPRLFSTVEVTLPQLIDTVKLVTLTVGHIYVAALTVSRGSSAYPTIGQASSSKLNFGKRYCTID